jgi:transglutaminase-like putative cysteine protease
VEVVVPAIPGRPVAMPIQGMDEFLAPTVAIQCDNQALVDKARRVLGEPKDAVAASRKLTSWVFAALDKEPTASFPTALDVLKHMKGDCNEHAVFFAALARAAGIPTKVAVGLVYLNGAFYYHAWNEVFLGEWVPVDATFGEFPAGAMRLKLSEGGLDQQTRILGVVGKLGMKILELQ